MNRCTFFCPLEERLKETFNIGFIRKMITRVYQVSEVNIFGYFSILKKYPKKVPLDTFQIPKKESMDISYFLKIYFGYFLK